MPVFEFQAAIDFQIPIYPPLYAVFGGQIGAKIDLTFGFDTYGLQKFFASEDKNPLLILDGFYVKDVDDDGNEVTEFTLTGGITAGAEVSLGFAEFGIRGGLFAEIGFDLNDPDNDGSTANTASSNRSTKHNQILTTSAPAMKTSSTLRSWQFVSRREWRSKLGSGNGGQAR